jgi:GNAT superfamily N-acetyltransferase
MADRSVRAPRLGDVAGLTDVQLRAWRGSGLPGVPDRARAERAWERAVMAPPTARHRVLVAVSGEVVTGVAATVPAADPDLRSATDSEVVLLVVDPAHRRQGHGSRLLAALVELMRRDGDELATAWVPATDDRTRAFLQGAGWAPDGAHRTAEVDDGSPAVRWVRLATSVGEDTP